jgi:hypothetical protein
VCARWDVPTAVDAGVQSQALFVVATADAAVSITTARVLGRLDALPAHVRAACVPDVALSVAGNYTLCLNVRVYAAAGAVVQRPPLCVTFSVDLAPPYVDARGARQLVEWDLHNASSAVCQWPSLVRDDAASAADLFWTAEVVNVNSGEAVFHVNGTGTPPPLTLPQTSLAALVNTSLSWSSPQWAWMLLLCRLSVTDCGGRTLRVASASRSVLELQPCDFPIADVDVVNAHWSNGSTTQLHRNDLPLTAVLSVSSSVVCRRRVRSTASATGDLAPVNVSVCLVPTSSLPDAATPADVDAVWLGCPAATRSDVSGRLVVDADDALLPTMRVTITLPGPRVLAAAQSSPSTLSWRVVVRLSSGPLGTRAYPSSPITLTAFQPPTSTLPTSRAVYVCDEVAAGSNMLLPSVAQRACIAAKSASAAPPRCGAVGDGAVVLSAASSPGGDLLLAALVEGVVDPVCGTQCLAFSAWVSTPANLSVACGANASSPRPEVVSTAEQVPFVRLPAIPRCGDALFRSVVVRVTATSTLSLLATPVLSLPVTVLYAPPRIANGSLALVYDALSRTINVSAPLFVDAAGSAAVTYMYTVGLTPGGQQVAQPTCMTSRTAVVGSAALRSGLLHHVTVHAIDRTQRRSSVSGTVFVDDSAPTVAAPRSRLCGVAVAAAAAAGAVTAACDAVLDGGGGSGSTSLVSAAGGGAVSVGCWSNAPQRGFVDPETAASRRALVLRSRLLYQPPGLYNGTLLLAPRNGTWTAVTNWTDTVAVASTVASDVIAAVWRGVVASKGVGEYRVEVQATNLALLPAAATCLSTLYVGK